MMFRETPTFSSETPHFFRIILEDTLQEEKLWIPKKFLSKYGKDLSDRVCLRLPCGSQWVMKLSKHEGKVWFKMGWSEFAKHYSLKRGDLLVFRYLDDSAFSVVICDSTFTEIDYPSVIQSKRKVCGDDDFSSCTEKTEETPPLQCCRPRKKTKFSPSTNCRNSKSKGNSCPRMKKRKGLAAKKGKSCTTRKRKFKLKPLRGDAKLAELEKASCYQPKRPSFRILIQPTCGDSVVVESKFAREYLTDKCNFVNLKVSGDERTWLVKYRIGVTRPEYYVTKFWNGWSDFVRDNNLKALDVCVFVLLKGSRNSFEVKIFRSDDIRCSAKPPLSPVTTSERPGNSLTIKKQKPKVTKKQCRISGAKKATILDTAHFESPRPNFKVLIQQSYTAARGYYLGIPSEFWRGLIKEDCNIILLRRGKSWPAEICVRQQSHGDVATIRDGWRKFADDNNLNLRDVCFFELVDEVKMLFNVRIRRYQGNY